VNHTDGSVDVVARDPGLASRLWERMQATAQVIREFEQGDAAGDQAVRSFVDDLKRALDGDILRDEVSGSLVRFRRGEGRLVGDLVSGFPVDCDEGEA
jgi:hypothetical protein